MRELIAGILLAVGLVACGEVDAVEPPWDGTGVVTALHFDDADRWTTTTQGMCFGYDKNGSCTYRSPDVIEDHYDPPHWYVQVTSEDGREHSVEVTETDWGRCRRGAEWLHAETRCRG